EAVTRERGAVPDVQVHEYSDLGDEPIYVLNPIADWWYEENQTNQPQCAGKAGQPQRLRLEIRMFRHPDHAQERESSQDQKRKSRKEREHEVPTRAAQGVRKRPQPPPQP